MHDLRFQRTISCMLLLVASAAACVLPSCASTRTDSRISREDVSSDKLPDVNPARAYLLLSDIEPIAARPASTGSEKPLSARARTQMHEARELAAEQRYTEAAIKLERALRYDPNHSEIHQALAILNWEAGNLQRAEAHATRALEVNPDNMVVHYLLGRCRASGGSDSAAITAYRTAMLCTDIEEHVDYAMLCHYYLAEVLADEGYLEAALAQYGIFESKAAHVERNNADGELARILQIDNGSTALVSSTLLERLGRFDKAAKILQPRVAASPADTDLGIRYAELLMRAGRLTQALDAVRAIRSNDDRVVRLLIQIHNRLGHGERVVEDLRSRLGVADADARLVLSLADVLLSFDRTTEARYELERYLLLHPRADEVRGRLLDALTAMSDWPAVLRAASEWITLEPGALAILEAKMTALSRNPDAVANLVDGNANPAEDYASAFLRGMLATSAGKLDQAEQFLNNSIAQGNAFAPARAALARVYMHQYRYDEAIQIAKRNDANVAENGQLERVLGEVHERLDDIEQAELHFKAAIQLNRADTEAMFLLAQLHNRAGRGLQAVRQLRALLEDYPKHDRAREMVALAHLQDGQYDAAVAAFEELKRLTSSANTSARCAALLAQLDKPDAETFRKTLMEAMEKNGPDFKTWIAIAESYDRFNDAPDVRSAYENAVRLAPDSEESALGLVQAEKRCLGFEKAAQMMKTLLLRRPNRHEWHIELIDLLWTTQDYDAALSLAKGGDARTDLDDTTRTRYRLAILGTYQLANKAGEALDLLKSWAEDDPENQRWTGLLAREYMRRDRASDAMPIYLAAYQADRSDRGALVDLVEAMLAVDEHDRAGQLVLDQLNEDPDNDAAVAMLARILSRADRLDESIELLRNRLLRTLRRQDLQDILIGHLLLAERNDECIDYINSLMDEVLSALRSSHERSGQRPTGRLSDEEIARRPDEPFAIPELHERLIELRIDLARALVAAKEFRDAEQELTAWIETSQDPQEKAGYLNQLALCHQLHGADRRANETLEQLLAIVPADPGLNNNVAYGWIDRGVRLDEAESLIRYAVWRQPRQVAYLDTFGWLLYKKGSFADAKKWTLRARIAIAQSDPVVLDHLGDICYRLGETDEAVEHWTAAVTAVRERSEEELVAEDIRRVRDSTQQKIDDVREDRIPTTASLAISELSEERDEQ